MPGTTKPIIVSFATNDRYRVYGERLVERCESLGLDHHVEFLEPWANKRKTCIYRTYYLCDLMKEYNRPLVWFDADGDILESFDIPDGVAGFVRNPFKHPYNHICASIFMVRDPDVLDRWKFYCDQWKPGEIGSHRRLCWVANEIDWNDMTPHVKGKVIVRTKNEERRL